MICAYVRIHSQAPDAALAFQRRTIALVASVCGDTIEQWFEDKSSSNTLTRPGLEALVAAVETGQVQKLYVTSGDRLTRDMAANVVLSRLLEGYGVRLVVCGPHASRK